MCVQRFVLTNILASQLGPPKPKFLAPPLIWIIHFGLFLAHLHCAHLHCFLLHFGLLDQDYWIIIGLTVDLDYFVICRFGGCENSLETYNDFAYSSILLVWVTHLQNRLTMKKCRRFYIYMIKIVFNLGHLNGNNEQE